ncbi:DUF3977 family protein [Mesobacillus subterraneus]|uniref:DUF3977 family protein n=1 Tax=Mesobacillus subterraneus TaxID=285983 RepID=A0A3R9F2Z3_9BACI|nr:DUF3977 family protein [Mesobacillus subterraneus]RSD28786.1 DUF3977 family protein [Mesobacillus subterraneus]
MKFIEFGIGNTWPVRTEFELEEGAEYEEKGIKGPIDFQSFYIRIWLSQTVFIMDTKDGFKKMKKRRRKWKFIIGIVSK